MHVLGDEGLASHVCAGADVNIKDIRGNTALDAAEKRGNSALVDILKAKGI